MDLKKLTTRAISGLLYVGIITGACFWGELGVKILASLFAVLAIVEFNHMLSPERRSGLSTSIYDCALGLLLINCNSIMMGMIWLGVFFGRFIFELYSNNPMPLRNLAHSILSQAYISLPLFIMTLLPYETSPENAIFLKPAFCGTFLLGVFIMIWINDTGAFLTGSLMGRHKLFESISPKKTWEGFIGGLVFNLFASTLFCYYGGTFLPYFHGHIGFWLGLGALVTIIGTWGDLVESSFKRSLNLKDSGNLIPGHGGILDRIDSLLLVAPFVFVYIPFYNYLIRM